jgi:zinc/manganese transport system substrate-binding protein
MKRYSLILFILVFGMSLSNAKLKIVTSTADLADLVRVVGKDRVTVDFIVRPTQNPHYVELKPSYMMKLKSADAFVMVGMQLELWAPQIIDGSRNANLMLIDCSKRVDKLEVPTGTTDASQGDVHPGGNPHYWLDPSNIALILDEIVDGLSKLAPHDAEFFRANARQYGQEISTAMMEWKKLLEPYRGKPLVTYHSSFSYFAARFGLTVIGYVEPKPGIAPTPSHVTELTQRMKSAGARIIGLEQFYEDRIPGSIAQATGATIVRLSTAVGGVDGTDSYRNLIDHNVRALAEAFKSHP